MMRQVYAMLISIGTVVCILTLHNIIHPTAAIVVGGIITSAVLYKVKGVILW